jgi:hypothetical protein
MNRVVIRQAVVGSILGALLPWSHHLQLTSEAEALITALGSSPPVHRVRGRTNNVTGRYPSPKMGRSIRFDSHQVEW